MKRFFKIVTFIFVFGILASVLVNCDFSVSAADSKYIEIVSGNGKTIGDEVRIGDEHFFILSNNGVELQMLAKYNVDISAKCTYGFTYPNNIAYEHYPMCGERDDSYTRLQDSSISGRHDDGRGNVIGVPFSTESQHGVKNTSYEGSVVQIYVEEYVAALNAKYGINVSGDLLDRNIFLRYFYDTELTDNVKKLLTATSWTKVNDEDGNMFILDEKDQQYFSYELDKFSGVRPVIYAPASALNVKDESKICKDDFCFIDNDKDGKVSMSDEVCIKEECFYVLSNKNNQVKLLAKYNLETGLKCSSDTNAGPLKSSLNNLSCEQISGKTLKQNITARGYIKYPNGDIASIGGVEYAKASSTGEISTKYDDSEAKKIVDEYVEYINSLVDEKFEGSLITLYDLTEATGEEFTNSTKYYQYQTRSIPDWIYANSYWTRSVTEGANIFVVDTTKRITSFEPKETGEFGIRPLLTVSADSIPTSEKDIDNSACYICGDEMVWTDEPDESSCKLQSDITDKKMCVNNPKTGIQRYTIQILIVISLLLIVLAVIGKQNRFKRI